MSFSLDTLTEGIKARNVGTANRRLLEKWGRTGLLRGMDGVQRENMATLLENQAGQLLRESSSLGGGSAGASDIRGFTNIAFPIVRRVFGGLIANELVSIQPMSLPSGLLFYLDYTYGSDVGGDADEMAYKTGDSIYGQPVNPKRSGASALGGQYDLAGTGYSRKHVTSFATNLVGDFFSPSRAAKGADNQDVATVALQAADAKWVAYDPVVVPVIDKFTLLAMPKTAFDGSVENSKAIDVGMVEQIALVQQEAFSDNGGQGTAQLKTVDSDIQTGLTLNVRRLNRLVKGLPADKATATTFELASEDDYTHVLMVVRLGDAQTHQFEADDFAASADNHLDVTGIKAADAASGSGDDLSTIVSPAFESDLVDGGANAKIPEIDIKIESVSVVAQTRKLRAKWSPELAQDLNAYHSLDAEVELTQILSEQIALEIDREILGDLLRGAQAANYYWSRSPGNFVNKRSGAAVSRESSLRPGPNFTGTVREWYETLIETIVDVANEIHRKTLRGSANFIVVSPEVATILEASVLYKPALSIDGDGQVASPMTIGAEAVGTLSSRFTVYKDPYFPRNKILVGFKGSSYLETGFVYAPYVPLIVTPTIFQPEDFTPRKGVMTRYGKKMVRGDFYGTVTCLDMDII